MPALRRVGADDAIRAFEQAAEQLAKGFDTFMMHRGPGTADDYSAATEEEEINFDWFDENVLRRS